MEGLYGLTVDVSRYIYLAVSLYMIIRIAVAMFFKKTTDPVRGKLIDLATGSSVSLYDRECSIGRNKKCDVILNYNTISRYHAVLAYRNHGFVLFDTHSKSGIKVNGEKINKKRELHSGDVLSLGGVDYYLDEEKYRYIKDKSPRAGRPPYILMLVLLMIVNLLSLIINSFAGGEFLPLSALVYAGNILLIWLYYLFASTVLKIHNFELEMIAFLLASIGLAVTGSIYPESVYKQFAAIFIGVVGYCALLAVLRFVEAVKVLRWIGAFAAVALLGATLLLANENNGALNWVNIGGISIQPSEFVKVIFVFVSAVTLERLQSVQSLTAYILFAAACVGELFLMRDFGAALIFFFTFIITAFMRSGDVRTIMLICFVAALGAGIIILFKPYVASRFETYTHIWEYPDEGGYQQTRTLIYTASGGLFGLGLGNGCLRDIFAAAEDLVFGVVSEELGIIMSFAVVAANAVVTVFAVLCGQKSKSVFYTISAVAASSMLLFQAMLNVFGVTDILPMTGVTLPFISKGGSSIICCFCLYAFIKSADIRTYASFKPGMREAKKQ